jgi:hypothetical protein
LSSRECGESIDGDLVAGDLADGEILPVNHSPCLG